MEAIVGLVGVAVGALIAPLLVSSYLAHSGDQLIVEP